MLAVLREAARIGEGTLALGEVLKRAGTGAATSVYLSGLVRRGLAFRVGRGLYTVERPPLASEPSVATTIDEDAAEDIRAAERLRIAGALARAVAAAVPREAQDYLNGFRDGADFVAERVLGLVLDVPWPTPL